MDRRTTAASLAVLALMAMPTVASAHSLLTQPAPRTLDSGLTEGPCGGVPSGPRAIFSPGETITVEWQVIVPHDGALRIDFSEAGDMNFDQYILAEGIIDDEGYAESMEITLPDMTCTQCTLRLTQVNPIDGNYYSCADIQLGGMAPAGDDDDGVSFGDSSGGAMTGEAQDPDADSGSDGCGCRSTGGAGSGWLLLLAFVFSPRRARWAA